MTLSTLASARRVALASPRGLHGLEQGPPSRQHRPAPGNTFRPARFPRAWPAAALFALALSLLAVGPVDARSGPTRQSRHRTTGARSAAVRRAVPPPMAPAQERRLAVDLLLESWRIAVERENDEQPHLLFALGLLSPEKGDRLLSTLKPDLRVEGRRAFLTGMLLSQPERALARLRRSPEAALAWRGDEEWYSGDYKDLLRLAVRVAARRHRAVATALLDYAERSALAHPDEIEALTCVAAAARDVGDGRVRRLTTEFLRRAAKQAVELRKESTTAPVFRYVRSLAEANPEAAEHLMLQCVPRYAWDTGRIEIVSATAERDPRQALALLLRHCDEWGPVLWAPATLRIVERLAPVDAVRAEELARRIRDEGWRARALAVLSRSVPEPRAARLRAEAVELAERAAADRAPKELAEQIQPTIVSGDQPVERDWHYTPNWEPALVAEAMPSGRERRRALLAALEAAQACRLLPEIRSVVAHAAFLLGPTDPIVGRRLLEDALAVCGQGTGGHEQRAFVALAYCSFDIRRAVQVARTIPRDGVVNHRGEVLHQIAQYLATPRAARRQIPFSEWAGSWPWWISVKTRRNAPW